MIRWRFVLAGLAFGVAIRLLTRRPDDVIDGKWKIIAVLPRKVKNYVCEGCGHYFDFTGSNYPASCPECKVKFIGIDERNQPSVGMVTTDEIS